MEYMRSAFATNILCNTSFWFKFFPAQSLIAPMHRVIFVQLQNIPKCVHVVPGIILCMRPANERRRYNVTSSLIGWAHSRYDPDWFALSYVLLCFLFISFKIISLTPPPYMMTSSNGNVFRVTGPLRGEFTIPRTKASDAELWCFLWSKQSWGWWFETPSCSLWRQCNDLTTTKIPNKDSHISTLTHRAVHSRCNMALHIRMFMNVKRTCVHRYTTLTEIELSLVDGPYFATFVDIYIPMSMPALSFTYVSFQHIRYLL